MNTSHIRPRCAHQRGQALVFTLAFAVVLCLVVLLLFNNSKLANAKTSLQNAADAAAYSAAVLQARDHNFSAYTNRAMIANQVAVAQFVSLKSYLDDAAYTRERMGRLPLSFAAFLSLSKKPWNAAKKIPIQTQQSAMSKLAPKAIVGLDRLIAALSKAQDVHHKATFMEMGAVANDVAQKNDPAVHVSLLDSPFAAYTGKQINAWRTFTDSYQMGARTRESDRFADTILHDDSQDGFTRNRAGVLLARWGGRALCNPPFVIGSSNFQFVHGGSTILSEDKKRWMAMDVTLGAGFQTCTEPALSIPPWVDVTIPIPDVSLNVWGGSAGALAGSNGGYELLGYKGNAWNTTAYGGSMALVPTAEIRFFKGPGNTLDSQGGLRDYYRDIAEPTGKKPDNQTPELNGGAAYITIQAERSVKGLRLANEILPEKHASGSTGSSANQAMRLDDAAADGKMRALASAQSYFYRPKEDNKAFNRTGWHRADEKTEMANLFSPYWQARLRDTPRAERLLSAGMQAL